MDPRYSSIPSEAEGPLKVADMPMTISSACPQLGTHSHRMAKNQERQPDVIGFLLMGTQIPFPQALFPYYEAHSRASEMIGIPFEFCRCSDLQQQERADRIRALCQAMGQLSPRRARRR